MMPYRRLATLALLGVACLAPLSFAQSKSEDRPAVFRCVLDKHARVVVCQLSDNLWAVYDARNCGLFKVWTGEINLTGTVYDTKHGPQPQSKGDVSFTSTGAAAWTLVKGGKDVETKARYGGYSLKDEKIPTFRFEVSPSDAKNAKPVQIEETPTEDGGRLKREIKVTGLPAGTQLKLGLDGAAIQKVDGDNAKAAEGDAPEFVTITGDGTFTISHSKK